MITRNISRILDSMNIDKNEREKMLDAAYILISISKNK